jgi:hypothetical protein
MKNLIVMNDNLLFQLLNNLCSDYSNLYVVQMQYSLQ